MKVKNRNKVRSSLDPWTTAFSQKESYYLLCGSQTIQVSPIANKGYFISNLHKVDESERGWEEIKMAQCGRKKDFFAEKVLKDCTEKLFNKKSRGLLQTFL